jgi:peptidoglycan hydrolase-like protein with peptidoglycan-binding domain
MLARRLFAVLALLFGLVGTLACLAGAYAVFQITARLEQANDRAATVIDHGIVSAGNRVRGVQQRVHAAKITTGEIQTKLGQCTTQQVQERLATQFDLERRMDVLSTHLETGDAWLESSSDSLRNLQKLLEISHSLGGRYDEASLDIALEKIDATRTALQDAEQKVQEIRNFATGVAGETDENRLARILKMIVRILATMDVIGTRLDDGIARLDAMRDTVKEGSKTIARDLSLAKIALLFVLFWIAAGQVALFRNGWRRLFLRPVS